MIQKTYCFSIALSTFKHLEVVRNTVNVSDSCQIFETQKQIRVIRVDYGTVIVPWG